MKRIKNKGFTLIELLGVIIILIAMLSLVIPKVINRVKSKDKENVIATLNSDILSAAARIYVDNHKKDYPEDEGSTYCTTIDSEVLNQIKKYMGTSLKDYNGNELNIVNKTIKVDYSNGYNVSIVDSNSCQPVYTNKDNCIGDNCKACYISKTYNNGVYKFEGKIINNSNKDGNLTSISDDIVGYTNDDGCTLKTLESAANEYVINKVKKFKKINGNEYCLSIKELIENGYLDGPIIYSGQDITNTHSYKVKYNKTTGKYSYEFSDSCQENLTCGTWIDLPSNMTPVVYDESVEKWKIVDETDPDWFDYENQKWANAVILTSAARDTKKVGDYVEVDILKNNFNGVQNTLETLDVLGMYVWIPRFSYTLYQNTSTNRNGYVGVGANTPDFNTLGGVDIKCSAKNVADMSQAEIDSTKTGTAKYYSSTPENYLTPPGFTFDGQELNGLWIGKFNLSYNNETIPSVSCSNNTCEAANNLRIIPNAYIPQIDPNPYFYLNLSMNMSNNIFNNGSDVNSHMEKSTEYATILYLLQSKYGKYGNSSYTNYHKELYINFYNKTVVKVSYIKSYSISGLSYGLYSNRIKSPYTYDYFGSGYPETINLINGIGASTTGNIYGIYDIYRSDSASRQYAGEFVAAKIESCNNDICNNYSKYFDFYSCSPYTTACNSSACLGHAYPEEFVTGNASTSYSNNSNSLSLNCYQAQYLNRDYFYYSASSQNDWSSFKGARNVIVVFPKSS